MNKIMRPKKVPQKLICVYVCMCAEKRKVYCNNSKNNNRKTWAKILETLKSTHAFQHMTIKSFTKRVDTIQPGKLGKNQRKKMEQIEDKILPFNSFQWLLTRTNELTPELDISMWNWENILKVSRRENLDKIKLTPEGGISSSSACLKTMIWCI